MTELKTFNKLKQKCTFTQMYAIVHNFQDDCDNDFDYAPANLSNDIAELFAYYCWDLDDYMQEVQKLALTDPVNTNTQHPAEFPFYWNNKL